MSGKETPSSPGAAPWGAQPPALDPHLKAGGMSPQEMQIEVTPTRQNGEETEVGMDLVQGWI